MVSEDGNPMKIVALWRKEDQRTLTITTQGDGEVDVHYRGKEEKEDALPHGAIIANDTTCLVVSAKGINNSDLRWIRVNGKVLPYNSNFEKEPVPIPKDKDIHVEAFFSPNTPNQHFSKVKVIGEPEDEVEVYNHKGYLFPNSPVKEGEQLIITARPSEGRRLVQLKVNGMPFQSGALYLVPSGVDVNVEAIFTNADESSFVLIVDASENGVVKVERKRKDKWEVINYGDPINALTDSIRVTATANPSAKLMKLFVNLAQVRYVDSTGSVVVKSRAGEGDFYVKAVFDEVKADRKPRLHIVALGGGTVNVFTVDDKEPKRLMDGEEIGKGTKIKVYSHAFSGSYAGILQINGQDWKRDAVYECDGKDVYVVAWFVDSHQTRLLIVIDDKSNVRGMGSVTVSDVREGTTIKNNTLLDQGDMFEVSVDTMLESAYSQFEVSGPAKRHPALKGVWTVDGDNEPIIVRVAFEPKWRITFKPNGGDLKDTVQWIDPTDKAPRVQVPPNPKKDGYNFKGWYKKGDTEKYRFADRVSSDLTLEARYEQPKPFLHVFVVDESLKALQGMQVIIKTENGDEVFKGTTDGNGVVCAQTDTGNYSIEVVGSDSCKGAKAESVELPSNGLDFTFVLQSMRKAEPSGVPSPVESVLLAGVEMYPNPANAVTTLYGLENARRVRVYAVQGVQMMEQEVYGSHELALHVENWVAGVYIVVVEAESGERRVLKLVVRR